MYAIRVRGVELTDGVLVLKSNDRKLMRALEILCLENKLSCETTVEVAPRPVKFKGVEPTPAAQAKADAKADIKAATDGK